MNASILITRCSSAVYIATIAFAALALHPNEAEARSYRGGSHFSHGFSGFVRSHIGQSYSRLGGHGSSRFFGGSHYFNRGSSRSSYGRSVYSGYRRPGYSRSHYPRHSASYRYSYSRPSRSYYSRSYYPYSRPHRYYAPHYSARLVSAAPSDSYSTTNYRRPTNYAAPAPRVYSSGENARSKTLYTPYGTVEPASVPATRAIGYGLESRRGWDFLKDGAYPEALAFFAAQASTHRGVAAPKVGYALASAASGQLRNGEWAMRNALGVDAPGLHYLHFTDEESVALREVLAQYAALPETDPARPFMSAAIAYLLRDLEEAEKNLAQARTPRVAAPSLDALARLISEAKQDLNPPPQSTDAIPRPAPRTQTTPSEIETLTNDSVPPPRQPLRFVDDK